MTMRSGVTPPREREAAFAACLAVVLTVGVLGVLLLNTAMQQQADRIAQQHQRVATLTQKARELQTSLDWQTDPTRLAARARTMKLRPIKQIDFVSARRPAAARAHAG